MKKELIVTGIAGLITLIAIIAIRCGGSSDSIPTRGQIVICDSIVFDTIAVVSYDTVIQQIVVKKIVNTLDDRFVNRAPDSVRAPSSIKEAVLPEEAIHPVYIVGKSEEAKKVPAGAVLIDGMTNIRIVQPEKKEKDLSIVMSAGMYYQKDFGLNPTASVGLQFKTWSLSGVYFHGQKSTGVMLTKKIPIK